MDEEPEGHCLIGVWDHERGTVEGTTTLPAESWLTRPGGLETREDLDADARRASRHGYPHGVSVRLSDGPPSEGRFASVSRTVLRFRLLKTGASADHFTVTFEDPVSEADAEAFAALFTGG